MPLPSDRLLVFYRSNVDLFYSQIETITKIYPGDWLLIKSSLNETHFTSQKNCTLISKPKLLLGQEFTHAIFDATESFNLDHFFMLVGSLKKESLLFILLNPNLNGIKDFDSERWNDEIGPIITPNFNRILDNSIQLTKKCYSSSAFVIDSAPQNLMEHLVDFIDQHKQRDKKKTYNQPLLIDKSEFIQSILNDENKIQMVVGNRGTGKSTIAGHISKQVSAIVTAPNKKSINSLKKINPDIVFFSPDELLKNIISNQFQLPHWIIIDEAAMIPQAILQNILKLHCNILLTTTIDGYEGSAQGLPLKLVKNYSIKVRYLEQNIRWNTDDAVHFFCKQLYRDNISPEVITNEQLRLLNIENITISWMNRSPICYDEFDQIWQLVKSAHYRTSFLDYRRLLDASKISVINASFNNKVIGSLLFQEEGNLKPDVLNNIVTGYRRPKGNMLVQSLAAHANAPKFAELVSIRINRITVNEMVRRKSLARSMIQYLKKSVAKKIDFISVSFAYDESLINLWLKEDFKFVHINTALGTSTGVPSIMGIFALSEKAGQEVDLLQKRLIKNANIIQKWLPQISFKMLNIQESIKDNTQLTTADWNEMKLFSMTQFSYVAVLPALYRLYKHLTNDKNIFNKNEETVYQNVYQKNFCTINKLVSSLNELFTQENPYKISNKNVINQLRKEIEQYITK